MTAGSHPRTTGPAQGAGTAWRRADIALPGGVRVATFELGSAAHPPIVLLHGLGHWSLAAWDALATLLADDYRLVAFDLPGFGDSERPEQPYDLTFFCAALEGVVERLALPRFGLVGHSLGGMIAAEFAGRHPARVAFLGLIDPAGFRVALRHLALMVAGAPGGGIFRLPASRRAVRYVFERAFYDRSKLEPAILERALTLAREQGLMRSFGRVYQGAHRQVFRAAQMRAGFARYRGPVALIWGRHDRYISLRALAGARRVYPQALVTILERSGHVPLVEEPEGVAAALRAVAGQ